MLTFDFCRGTEAVRSFPYIPEDDDAEHSTLFKIACQFLRVYWVGAVEPS